MVDFGKDERFPRHFLLGCLALLAYGEVRKNVVLQLLYDSSRPGRRSYCIFLRSSPFFIGGKGRKEANADVPFLNVQVYLSE